jgi:hypothetical protein
VGRAPAVLGIRAAAFVALAALLGLYYAFSESLWTESDWWDVAWLGLGLMPAVFALVLIVLPLQRARGLLFVSAAFGALAALATEADIEAVANFAKLGGITALAFWFLGYFEELSLIVLVAMIVPLVDSWSVWRGPTHDITKHHIHVYTNLSFAFPLPGEHASANLGLPDLLFFALFLAAASRFGLRARWTWLAMTLSFGVTIAIAVATHVSGLPALPGLSIAFVGVNADLIWRHLRAHPLSFRDTS